MRCSRCGMEAGDASQFCGYCGAALPGPTFASGPYQPAGAPVPPTPPYYPTPAPYQRAPLSDGDRLLRYFLHGLIYTVLGVGLSIILAVMTALLTVCGWIFGLIIALAIIVLAIGGLNSFVNNLVWKEEMDTSLTQMFIHGLFLLLMLVVVSIPQLVLNAVVPSLVLTVVLFIAYLPINGFVAHWVAQYFRRKASPAQPWPGY